MSIFEEIAALFAARGNSAYFGESVTQTEHALQTAQLAESDGAPPALIVAALLHDVGHLLHTAGEDVAERGVDTRHERIGARWLLPRLGACVSEPVRLHVAAKRYLCGVDPDYLGKLSPASAQSLALQGGAMRTGEARQFERQDHWQEAVRLRRWDEAAKVVGLPVKPVEHYRAAIESCHQAVAAHARDTAES